MQLDKRELAYYKSREQTIPWFWSKFPMKPSFKDATVLDVGCGHGSLSVDIALDGARKVVGIDIASPLIIFARENLRQNYPELSNVIEFADVELKEYPDVEFDYMVAMDSFEHIIDLDEVLVEMKKRLKPGGKIFAGISPLWNSPFGDHLKTRTHIPWGHLLVPERIILNRLNRFGKDRISSIYDLGLNKMSLSDYKRVFSESGLNILYFRVNESRRSISKLISLIRRIPFLEEYLSFSIYAVFEKS